MEDKMKFVERLKELYPNGKLSCTDARRLAEEWNLKVGDMGELCDEAKIKINQCELGCF